jgi:4-hydroxybenzoate polyprenyltransferase
MLVRFKGSALKEGHWYEHVVRFRLGGTATVAAGLIAKGWGPAVGGLFLAFPAIFIASATMVEKHERERKERKGYDGRRRGQDAAGLDAAGACWGTLALAAFALVTAKAAALPPTLCLGLASLTWLLTAIGMFFLRRALRPHVAAVASALPSRLPLLRKKRSRRTLR